MRSAVIILGLVGACAAAVLGAHWLEQQRDVLDQLQPYRPVIATDTELARGLEALEDRLRAAYALIASAVLALLGTVLAAADRPHWAAVPLLLAGLLPVLFEPEALVFTFLLVVAGILALMTRRHESSPTSYRRVGAGEPHA